MVDDRHRNYGGNSNNDTSMLLLCKIGESMKNIKYIRTKETIYEVVEEKELVVVVKAKNGKGTYAKSKSQIDMKQYSDNLYRLINKFVVVYKNGKSVVSKYMFKTHKGKYLKKMEMGGKIFGAIWVDNNGIPMLKSVAIMINDKGELELL